MPPPQRSFGRLSPFTLAILLLAALTAAGQSGGGIDYTGTGGQHTIQGRIYFPSGRRADLRAGVKLQSASGGELSVLADLNGSFSFRALMPGSYTVVVEAGDNYEIAREPVFIDGPSSLGRSTRMASTPRVMTVPIYLRPRRAPDPSKPGLLDATLAGIPKPALDLYERGRAAAAAGDTKVAIENLKNAVSLHPDFVAALDELGVQYLRAHEPREAADALRASLKRAPEAFNARLNYGIALLEMESFAEAEKELRRAKAKNEDSPTAHLYLGLALIKLRDFAEAERELERADALGNGQLWLAHKYLGGLYWHKREYRRAADALERYLKLVPQAADREKIQATIKELRAKS